MKCQFCGTQLGLARRLFDSQYCSADHRKRSSARSARASRDHLSSYGDEDLYPVDEVMGLQRPEGSENKDGLQKMQAGVATAISVVLLFVLAYSWVTGQGGNAEPSGGDRSPLVGEIARSSDRASSSLLSGLRDLMPARPPIHLKEDFKGSVDNWLGAPLSAAMARSPNLRDLGWNFDNGMVRPGRLRIWQPSVDLADYKMEFEGTIEKRAMSWTYRSVNLDNYYASKIVVRKPGPIPTLEIVRYAMLDGKEDGRARFPLPMNVLQANNSIFHVETKVRGGQFTTYINGLQIDTWSDSRIKKGGVGFFAEAGEVAAIHWVNVEEERAGLLGRVLSLGFFVGPAVQFGPIL